MEVIVLEAPCNQIGRYFSRLCTKLIGWKNCRRETKVDTIKLVKFRSLADEEDLCRVIRTIKTGEFWCSKLWNMNDPMEGVYSTLLDEKEIAERFKEKDGFVICSFSSEDAIHEPLLWGYYANGFKGIAIVIEVDEKDVLKHNENGNILPVKNESGAMCNVRYIDWVDWEKFKKGEIDFNVENIITRKLSNWKTEKEYRFLKKSSDGWHKISGVKRVYLGDPYCNVVNREKYIILKLKKIKQYMNYREIVEDVCAHRGIKVCYAKIEGDNNVSFFP